jgi:hypothetical protein
VAVVQTKKQCRQLVGNCQKEIVRKEVGKDRVKVEKAIEKRVAF